MSVVAVKKLGTLGFEIAADSIGVRYTTQSKGDRTNLAKLVEVNGVVIGGVGFAEELSLLILYCETRRPADPSEMSVLNFLSEFSTWKSSKIAKHFGGNEYFIGFGGKVFHVNGWQVDEVRTFEAIGAGMDYALTALHLGHTVQKAVEVAIELSIYCESPVISIKKAL